MSLSENEKDWIERVARIPVDDTGEEPDVCIIELGGTVGDIESMGFIEAMRQLRRRAGKDNFLQIHVSLVPVVNDEQKTKPTQTAIRDVKQAGLIPDLIACRCAKPLQKETTDKIARFCDVDPEQVLAVHDVPSTYHVPLHLHDQNLISHLHTILHLNTERIAQPLREKGKRTWHDWVTLTRSQERLHESVTIALVGKYTTLHDSYLSVVKALEHSAMACSRKLNLVWIDASHLEDAVQTSSPVDFHRAYSNLYAAAGILVPGGFGDRGTAGMMRAIQVARENRIPFLGICLGMQLAVIEYARNVCKIPGADSEEFNKGANDPMIIFMPEGDKNVKGGTMRLGLRDTLFQPGSEWSQIRQLYESKTYFSLPYGINEFSKDLSNGSSGAVLNKSTANGALVYAPSTSPGPLRISERHRHRYEVNPAKTEMLTNAGLHFVGKDESGQRMEIVELRDHPLFVGVQFHPEYLSRVLEPSKPYLGFVAASARVLDDILGPRKQSRKHPSAGADGFV